MTVSQEQAASGREFHFEGRGPCTVKVERWRANGAIKLWKTRPGEFQLPIKWGLRSYDYLTNLNAHQFHLDSECPNAQPSPVLATTMVVGAKYRVVYRLPGQRRDRAAVVRFMDLHEERYLFDARPDSGNVTLRAEWISEIRPGGDSDVYVNRII